MYEVMYGLCSVQDYDGSLVKGTDAETSAGAAVLNEMMISNIDNGLYRMYLMYL